MKYNPDLMSHKIAGIIATRVSSNLYSLGYSEAGAEYLYDILVDALIQEDAGTLQILGKELSIPVDTSYGK